VTDIVINPRIDELEVALARNLPPAETRVEHLFTPGLYVRTCYIPAGSIVTGKIHLTEHPFMLVAGTIHLRDENGEWDTYDGPFLGVTKPGTRRVLLTLTDVIWSTFHATTKTEPAEVEAEIILKHDEHLLAALEGA